MTSQRNYQSAGTVPLAGFVSFSSDPVFLTVLVGVEAQGRSYGSRVCEKKKKSPREGTNTWRPSRCEYQTSFTANKVSRTADIDDKDLKTAVRYKNCHKPFDVFCCASVWKNQTWNQRWRYSFCTSGFLRHSIQTALGAGLEAKPGQWQAACQGTPSPAPLTSAKKQRWRRVNMAAGGGEDSLR